MVFLKAGTLERGRLGCCVKPRRPLGAKPQCLANALILISADHQIDPSSQELLDKAKPKPSGPTLWAEALQTAPTFSGVWASHFIILFICSFFVHFYNCFCFLSFLIVFFEMFTVFVFCWNFSKKFSKIFFLIVRFFSKEFFFFKLGLEERANPNPKLETSLERSDGVTTSPNPTPSLPPDLFFFLFFQCFFIAFIDISFIMSFLSPFFVHCFYISFFSSFSFLCDFFDFSLFFIFMNFSFFFNCSFFFHSFSFFSLF